jgi:TRAP-type mannitol/chloroaromatic compound transport system permease small subunit
MAQQGEWREIHDRRGSRSPTVEMNKRERERKQVTRIAGWLRWADHGVAVAIAAGQWLVLPVSVLLFAQWPLRDLVHAYATQANDLAQWMFALYASLALTYATRERAHLASDAFAHRYSGRTRARIARIGECLCVAPWSLFILVVSAPGVWQSLRGLEKFPETYDPGYFIIKVATWLLALLALAQTVLGVRRSETPS